MVQSNSTYPTPQAPLGNLNKQLSRLFPRIRAKPLHRSFYEFKSKLNPFHVAGSNRYKYLNFSSNTPQLSERVNLPFEALTTIFSPCNKKISLKNKMNKNKIGSLDRTTNNGNFEQTRIGEFIEDVYLKCGEDEFI